MLYVTISHIAMVFWPASKNHLEWQMNEWNVVKDWQPIIGCIHWQPMVRWAMVRLNYLFIHSFIYVWYNWKRKTVAQHDDFFAVLLLPVLDGFEWLLSLGTVHQLSSAAVIESLLICSEKNCSEKIWADNRTRATGGRSLNATTVLWRPPTTWRL